MSSKYIDNSAYVTSGYTLSGAFQSVTIGPEGVIGGPGLVGGTAESYTIVNRGTVTGTSFGIQLKDGGIVTNSAGALIEGTNFESVNIMGGIGTVANAGTLMSAYGASLDDGGAIINSGTAAVIGGNSVAGVGIYGGSGTVSNSGTIEAGISGAFTYDGVGILLTMGGNIVNSGADALIHGATDGVLVRAGLGTVNNSGEIIANGYPATGVDLEAGGIVINNKGALIEGMGEGQSDHGNSSGVVISGGSGTVSNNGQIIGYCSGGTGVLLQAGGCVINGTGALIEGMGEEYAYGGAGIMIQGLGTVVNRGIIHGFSSYNTRQGDGVGVDLQSGVVINAGSNALIAGYYGVYIGLGTVVNTGTIKGGGYNAAGVKNYGGGTISNGGKNALIEGYYGIDARGDVATTIDNFGTIAGTCGTAVMLGAAGDVLIDEAGSRFIGNVIGDRSTLQLAGVAGTLAGLGTKFIDFGAVDVLAQAAWTLTGTDLLASGTTSSLIDDGILTLDGTSTIAGTVAGAGTLDLAGDMATFEQGASLTVAHLVVDGGTAFIEANLSYAGSFLENAGTISLKADTLLLKGAAAFMGGVVSGGGVLATRKGVALSALAVSDGAIWQDYAMVTASGPLALGNARDGSGRLTIESTGVFDIIDNTGVTVATGGIGSLLDRGVLEKAAGTGISTIGPAIVNSGTVRVTSGMLNLAGAVSGRGEDLVGLKGTLKFDGTVSVNQTVSFAGTTGGELILGDPSGKALGFSGGIAGFKDADKLDIASFVKAGAKLAWKQSGAKGTLTVTDGSDAAKIIFFGQYILGGFKASTSAAGTVITYTPPAQTVALAAGHH